MKFNTGKCNVIHIRTTIQMLHTEWCALRWLSLLQACGVCSSAVPQAQKDRAQPQMYRGSNKEEDQGYEMDPVCGMAGTPA